MPRDPRQGISRETMRALGEVASGMDRDGVFSVGYGDEAGPSGLGEELEDAIDHAVRRPTTAELERLRPAPVRKDRPAIPARQLVRQSKPSEDAKDIIWTIEVIPNVMVISNWRGGVTPFRIDNGISDRTDIVIANMSQQVIWINTDSASLSAGPAGVPLRAMSGATAYDGGVFRARVTEAERYWAVAAGGAANLIVTVELARR
jgi:hypothetical protein